MQTGKGMNEQLLQACTGFDRRVHIHDETVLRQVSVSSLRSRALIRLGRRWIAGGSQCLVYCVYARAGSCS
jgi:hypothetical protein